MFDPDLLFLTAILKNTGRANNIFVSTASTTLSTAIAALASHSPAFLPVLLEASVNANKHMRVISMGCILEVIRVCNVEDLVSRCEVLQEAIRLGSVDRDG